MSAFLVSDATLQRAAIGFLLGTLRYGETATAERVTVTGARLAVMNCAALFQRYGDDDNPPAPKLEAMRVKRNGVPDYSTAELVQIYKSMTCVLYQCSEGNVPETELYQQTEIAAGKVASMIVQALPEYAAARWD